jgi:hypothetical protein
MEERGFEQSLSVFICVHLWLQYMVTASPAGQAFQPGKAVSAGVAGPGFARIQTPAQLRAGEPAPQKAGARNNMKISSTPKSGRVDSVAYLNTRHGKVVRG